MMDQLLFILGYVHQYCGKALFMLHDFSGYTALHWYCSGPHLSYHAISKLYQYGGRELVMVKSLNQSSALHVVCNSTNPDVDAICMLSELVVMNY
jgi:hypothetical protein